MKKTVGLYAARACSGPAYIYNQKLIPQGNRGVHTVDGDFPSSGDMVNAKGLFELMGIPFPEGATFELDITVTEQRKKGWYPVIVKEKVSLRETDISSSKVRKEGILWWNGGSFVDDSPINGCTYGEEFFSWIADEPIPDPFERVP